LYSVEQKLKVLFVSGRAGNASDYRSFLSRLTLHLRNHLRRRIPHCHEDVEDLAQEILFAVHSARNTFRADEPLTAWVHAIARHKLMDFFRARARRELLHSPINDCEEIFVESSVDFTDARRDIGMLLERLPDKQRLSIVHVKLHGLSVADAAGLIGFTKSDVKVSIHRGLKTLAERVREAA
jgi:RNA polymerase sigma-70 factor, ECF subfamily